MPFTGSHPAAVLPLLLSRRTRARLAPSGLVIGSMSPDLPYYLPIHVPVSWTHSARGVVGFDLLLGLVAVWAWHGLLGPAAVTVAPGVVRDRIPTGLPMPARLRLRSGRLVAVVVSLVIGAATHVFWDAFTHPDRFGTAHISWLATEHAGLDGYRWAQYASGLLGGVLLLVATGVWWLSSTAAWPRPGLPVRGAFLAWTALACALLAGGFAGAFHYWDDGLRRILFAGATWGGGCALAAALLIAMVVQSFRGRASSAAIAA